MSSVNNIYLVNIEPPVKKYVKTIPSKLGGIRFDARGEREVGFVLETINPDQFVYDDEVLEVYTEREDRALRQLNRKLFELGYLKEYAQDAPALDTANMLSDEEILEVAKTPNINTLKARLLDFTSAVTVERVLKAAQEVGRPAKTLEVIKQRLDTIR